jgi:hypothetical protein
VVEAGLVISSQRTNSNVVVHKMTIADKLRGVYRDFDDMLRANFGFPYPDLPMRCMLKFGSVIDSIGSGVGSQNSHLEWAVQRWKDEVGSRPLQNVNRRSLDDTWRQVIHRFGGDDVALCGPRHDDLVR